MLLVLAAAAAALAYITARLATAPVRRLAIAAQALGRDLDRPPLPETGPREVRQGARAFNTMQAQLRRREAERTHMLAAITHDLQTPLTRLRLRLDKVGDPPLREALLADQAATMELIHDGLNLARAAAGDGGGLRDLDLDSLLQSLCEDAVQAGPQVSVVGRSGLIVRTRPEALKRSVANLLDNAVKHAGSAELRRREAPRIRRSAGAGPWAWRAGRRAHRTARALRPPGDVKIARDWRRRFGPDRRPLDGRARGRIANPGK